MREKTEYNIPSLGTTRKSLTGGFGTKGSEFFNLPPGIELWTPEKPGSVKLDFLPYLFTSDVYPDKDIQLPPNSIWWKHPFQVARGIGVENASFISPLTKGLPCPVAEERRRLYKMMDALPKDSSEYHKMEQAAKALRLQRLGAYIIKHPDDPSKIAVFFMSTYCFDDKLLEDLKTRDESFDGFWHVLPEVRSERGRVIKNPGHTMHVWFTEDTFQAGDGTSGKFLRAARFEFIPRAPMDLDEILEKTPRLDKCFNILPYKKLRDIFLGLSQEEVEKQSVPNQSVPNVTSVPTSPSATPSGANSGKTTTIATEPKFKVGDQVQIKRHGKMVVGKITEIEGTEVLVEDSDGDDIDADMDELMPVSAASEPAVSAPQFKVGDKVSWDDGDEEGTIVKMHSSGEKAKVKDDAGIDSWVTVSNLTQLS